jgi:predicted dehydrogenase
MSHANEATTPNRRDFLTAGAAVAAGLSLSPHLYAAESDEIRVGLIGCGGRGTGAAEQCIRAAKGMKLVAMGDAFKDRLEGCLGQLKGLGDAIDVPPERRFVGLDAYEQVIKACDLVVLATPPGFRPLHIQAAVAAGKHIFTEKPVAVDGPGIRKVLEAYEEAKKKNLGIVAGTQRRHQKRYLESMQRIHGGDIGDIVAGRCYWNQGKLWHNAKRPGWTDVEWQIRNWLYFVWLSGDHICEQHVHNLDVMQWALGANPVRAVGMGGRQVRIAPEFGHIFDHHCIDFEYPNGVHVMSMCRQIDGCEGNVSEAVVGTKGDWASEIMRGKRRVRTPSIAGEKPWTFEGGERNPYEQEHIDLIESIRSGKPLNELKTVAESTLVAIMGRMATYTGIPITWEMALGSKEETFPEKLTMDMSLPVPEVATPGKTKFV